MLKSRLNNLRALTQCDEDETTETLEFDQAVRLVDGHNSAVSLLVGRRLVFANRAWRNLFGGYLARGLGRNGILEPPETISNPGLGLRIDSGGLPLPPNNWAAEVELPDGWSPLKFSGITLGRLEGRYLSAVAAFREGEEITGAKWAFAAPRLVDLNLLGVPASIFSLADGSLLGINEEGLAIIGVKNPAQPAGLNSKRTCLIEKSEWARLAERLFVKGRVAEAHTVARPIGGPAVLLTSTLTAFNHNGLAAALVAINRAEPCSRPGRAGNPPPSEATIGREESYDNQLYNHNGVFLSHPCLLRLNLSLFGRVTYLNELARNTLSRYLTVPADNTADQKEVEHYSLPHDLTAAFKHLASNPKTSPRYESEIIGPDGRKISIIWTILGFFNAPGRPVEIAVAGYNDTAAIPASRGPEAALEQPLENIAAQNAVLNNFNQAIQEPMTVLLSYLELIADPGLLTDHQPYLRLVRQAVMTMNNLTTGLKDLGLTTLESDPFQLDTVILEALELVQAEADRKKLILSSWLQPGTPTRLLGDAPRLKQLLWHLLDNAVSHTEAGRVLLSARALAKTEPGETTRLLFTVTDMGPGLPPGQGRDNPGSFPAGKAPAGNHSGGGLGLGLYLCRKISALMGGGLEVESLPGQGSTFMVNVEFKRQAQPRHYNQNNYYKWLTMERPAGRREKSKTAGVLLIESRSGLITMLSKLFGSVGLPLTVTRDGYEALLAMERALVRKKPFQMVIIGSRFKGFFSAYDLLRKVRENYSGRLPALIMIGDHRTTWFLDHGRPEAPFYAPRKYLSTGAMKSVRALLFAHTFHYLAIDQQPFNLVVSAEMRPDSGVETQLDAAFLKKGHRVFIVNGDRWPLNELPENRLNLFFTSLPLNREEEADPAPPQAENFIPMVAVVGPYLKDAPLLRPAGNKPDNLSTRWLADLLNRFALIKTDDPPMQPPNADSVRPPERPAPAPAEGVAVSGHSYPFHHLPPPGEALAVLDKEDVLKRIGGDQELLAVLARMVDDSLSETLAKINRAAALGDVDGLRFQAHFLRGAASNMGAQAVTAKAFILETLPWPCNFETLTAALKALEYEVERLRPELKKLKAVRGGGNDFSPNSSPDDGRKNGPHREE